LSDLPGLLSLLLFENKNLSNVELRNFPNLRNLNVSKCDLKELRLSQLPELAELILDNNKNLSRINLRGFPNLKKLRLSDCDIRELNLSGLPELTKFLLYDNRNLDGIDLRGFPNLKELSLSDCGIRKLNLSGLPELAELSLSGNRNLSKIDLREFPKIETLFKPEREGNDLKEVLLHKSNKAYPGITKIKYGRDSRKRPTSVEYFDENGQYADLPKYGFAKIVIEYDAEGKGVQKRYTAEELK
jgi:uncharacterized protein YjbI with pentapeptide repeats